VRGLALLALLFFTPFAATPIAQFVVPTAASSIAAETGACADDCKEDGDCCPAPCVACSCCAHSTPVAIAAPDLPNVPAPGGRTIDRPADLPSPGFVSLPFRPPTA
jgi:hypothetical protein